MSTTVETNLVIDQLTKVKLTEPEQKIENLIVNPNLYNTILQLLSQDLKVLTIIIGNENQTESTTIVKKLTDYANQMKIPISICDNQQIQVKSQLVVLQTSQLKKCNKAMEDIKKKGYVCIVLETTNREKIDPFPPMYYGIFVSDKEMSQVFDKNILYSQTTPLHVTCLFVGGNKKLVVTQDVLDTIGKEYKVNVMGLSESSAGSCLVVSTTDLTHFPGKPTSQPHITLSTNSGFKPVDVGKQITLENTKKIAITTDPDKSYILTGTYSPTW